MCQPLFSLLLISWKNDEACLSESMQVLKQNLEHLPMWLTRPKTLSLSQESQWAASRSCLTSPCCQPAGFVDGAVLTSIVANHHKSGPAASFDTEWEVSLLCCQEFFLCCGHQLPELFLWLARCFQMLPSQVWLP